MNLLDENIRHDQGEQLRKWRVKFRFLIRDLARSGIQDPDIIPLLHHANAPTFFTHDKDYFRASLAHPAYCLAWLDMFDGDAALYIRRFLRHPAFRTQAQRRGKVAHVHAGGVRYFETSGPSLRSVNWTGP